LRARPNAFEIALKRIDNRRVGNEDGIVVLAGEPREKLPEPVRNTAPSTA